MFATNRDLVAFARELADDLRVENASLLADALDNWSKQFFTTSSEFLGELKLLLDRVSQGAYLTNPEHQRRLHDCLEATNRALGLHA